MYRPCISWTTIALPTRETKYRAANAARDATRGLLLPASTRTPAASRMASVMGADKYENEGLIEWGQTRGRLVPRRRDCRRPRPI